MRKTSLYLEESDIELLKRLADSANMSQARVLREALALYAVRGLSEVDHEFALFDVADGPGGSIADVPEEEQLRGFGE